MVTKWGTISRARFLATGFAVLLALIPFVFDTSFAPKGWELPKVAAIQIFLLLLLSVYALSCIVLLRPGRKLMYRRDKILLVVLLIFSFSSFVSQFTYNLRLDQLYNPLYQRILDPSSGEYTIHMAIFGNQFRETGLITMSILFATAWVAMREIRSRHLPFMFAALGGGALLQAIFGIMQFLLIGLQNTERFADGLVVYGTFGQNNFYSGYLLCGLVATAYFLANKDAKIRLISLISSIIIILGILLSLSYFAWIVMILLVAIVIREGLSKQKSLFLRQKPVIIAVAMLSLPMAILLLQVVPDYLHRINIWNAVLQQYIIIPMQEPSLMNTVRLFFGSGFDTLQEFLYRATELAGSNIDRSHNIIFDVLAFTGIFGLLVMAFLARKAIKISILSRSRQIDFAVILVFIWFVRSLIHTSSILNLLVAFIFVGALIGAASDLPSRKALRK